MDVRRRLSRALRLLASGVLAAFAANLVLGAISARQVEAQLEAIRAAGEPLSPTELEPEAVPDEENAARIYELAFSCAAPRAGWTRNGKYVEGSAEAEERLLERGTLEPLVAQHLARNEDSLALATRAASMPRCTFVSDYSEGYRVSLNHLTSLLDLARTFRLRALHETAQGSPDAAMRTVATGLGLVRALDSERFLISREIQGGLEAIALDALRLVLERGEPSETACEDLRRLIATGDRRRSPLPSLLLARTLAIQEFAVGGAQGVVAEHDAEDHYDEGPSAVLMNPPILTPTEHWLYRLCPVLDNREQWHYLDVMSDLVEAAGRSDGAEFARKAATFYSAERHPRCPVAGWILPWPRSFEKAVDVEAVCRVARAGLALRIHRLRTGDYPGSLEEIGGVLEDPWASGQPLHYRREEDGFRVWSVGRNGVDDEGRKRGEDEDWKADDVAWAISR